MERVKTIWEPCVCRARLIYPTLKDCKWRYLVFHRKRLISKFEKISWFIFENAQTTLVSILEKVKTQSMFTEPETKKETNEGGSGEITAAQGQVQVQASQGPEGKAQGM